MGAHLRSIAEAMPEGNGGTNKDTGPAEKRPRGRGLIVPIAALALVVIITGGLFYLGQFQPEVVKRFIALGYLGCFIICLVSNATVILPVPGILLFIPVISEFNPVLLGLVGATGGAIGEVTGYLAGRSGRGIIGRGKTYVRFEGWMKRYGMWGIFAIAAIPLLPVDIAGIIAGAAKMPVWKFLLPVWAGKTVKYVSLMVAASFGWPFVNRLI